ncbi:phosphatase [Pilimelia terevasa]|uniref:Phosphatase n=1 Tax=Pilimelia terevasa TaxID=53372 RepID=A0A8J3FKT5_9ACTN|nr:HAD hydrolase-like protein [Pilimelia terevasa]GGK30111.1 phosphatase [Pilimelia terevasa]
MSRPHLVWDWNGTLLDDLALVISATNAAFTSAGAGAVDPDTHRRRFRRPIVDYYGEVLGRELSAAEFAGLDAVFHEAYRRGLVDVRLAADAEAAMRAWPGGQSLLSMWFHDELVPAVRGYGLDGLLRRVDGLRHEVGGGSKHAHLVAHLAALELPGSQVVLIGDTVDDAEAAAAVGAACVLYTGGLTDPDQLRGAGVPVADTLLAAVELARATG